MAVESAPYAHPDVAALIDLALREDVGTGDLTCHALVPAGARLGGTIIAKESGVVCGLELFARVFARIGGVASVSDLVADGTRVDAGTVVMRMQGDAATLLQGERTALNFCQRLSGTATLTRQYVDAVAGTRAGIFDTRKTTPGMRILQKHAVASGGGRNLRMGLYDQLLIKENHIALMPGPASGAAEAVRRSRAACGERAVIEVEIEDLRDLEPVMDAGADIILLDNMPPASLIEAVARRDRAQPCTARRVELEASGGITLATVRAVAQTGVERISTGELTHSVRALDLSMRCAPMR